MHKQSLVLGQLGLKETLVVAAWYIWWQRREFVKGESTTPASSSAFSMQALTLNYSSVPEKATLRKIIWSSPPGGSYKMSVDAVKFTNLTFLY
jgi:hypothetical protein